MRNVQKLDKLYRQFQVVDPSNPIFKIMKGTFFKTYTRCNLKSNARKKWVLMVTRLKKSTITQRDPKE